MSQQVYRANLSASYIPMSVYGAGRTVIVPGPDNNYDKRIDPSDKTIDVGIPQVIYARNVIPTYNGDRGIRSVAAGNTAPGFYIQDDYVQTEVGDTVGKKEFHPNRFKIYCTPAKYRKAEGASYWTTTSGPKVLWAYPVLYPANVDLPGTDSDTDRIFEFVGGECRDPIDSSGRPLNYYTRRVVTGLTGSANDWLRLFGAQYSQFNSANNFITSAVVGLDCFLYAMRMEQDGSVHDTFTARKVRGMLFMVKETQTRTPISSDLARGLYSPELSYITSSTLPALAPADFFEDKSILGICGSSGYLIAYSSDTIYWSSLTTPTDFQSSLITGAGSAVPDGLTSDIHRCIPITKGFIIYTGAEIISATYTGNSKFPWKFTLVSATSGVDSLQCTDDYISYDNDQSYHLVSCTDGNIRQVTLTDSEIVLAEVSDHLKQYSEDYEVNDTALFTDNSVGFMQSNYVNQSGVLPTVAEAFNRYIIINGKYIFDKELKRYGRFSPTNPLTELPYQFRGLMCFSNILLYFKNTPDSVSTKETLYKLDLNAPSADSLVILGKFQYVRARNISLQGLEFESLMNSPAVTLQPPEVRVISSMDGQTFSKITTPYTKSMSPFLQSYLIDVEAKNVCIAIRGSLNLSSVLLTYTLGGAE